MECVIASQAGGPDVLTLSELDLPALGSGELRVAVEVAGVNFWDIMQRRGTVPLPASRVPGVEGAGSVVAVGCEVNGFVPGDRVAWSKVPGSYAEQVQGPVEWFVPVPESLANETAAAALMQGTTAWYLATQTAVIDAGETAVVLAAAGGVGHLLTQLLAERGVTVIGVVGSAPKASIPTALGAATVLIDSDRLVEEVRTVAAKGATVVFDANGGPSALRDLDMLGPRGTVVYYGTAAGPLPSLDLGLLSAGSLAVRRVRGHDYVGDPAEWRLAANEVMARLADGRLQVRVDSRVALADVARQHERLESRVSAGKLLVDVAPASR